MAAVDVVPSPKFHEREAIEPSLSVDVSVKFTDKFDTVLLKLATAKTFAGGVPVHPAAFGLFTQGNQALKLASMLVLMLGPFM